ncbi:hypothetical protein COO60DRAFT_794711 [Scenedesmus sp. NREL 46B-D3]|nr:hypothetical protein COO60DRAFT_794711 [Scenedesmus sp. NREL 46B-D3]
MDDTVSRAQQCCAACHLAAQAHLVRELVWPPLTVALWLLLFLLLLLVVLPATHPGAARCVCRTLAKSWPPPLMPPYWTSSQASTWWQHCSTSREEGLQPEAAASAVQQMARVLVLMHLAEHLLTQGQQQQQLPQTPGVPGAGHPQLHQRRKHSPSPNWCGLPPRLMWRPTAGGGLHSTCPAAGRAAVQSYSWQGSSVT